MVWCFTSYDATIIGYLVNASLQIEFVKWLIKKAGVAAVPGCGFFHSDPNVQEYHNRYVRFAFCKSDATLNAAAQKMGQLVNRSGYLDL